MSTVKANDLTNVTGGIPTVKSQQLIPTAWVSFNQIGNSINGDEGISSLTDNATGDFTINFSSNMANVNYSSPASCGNNNNPLGNRGINTGNQAVGSVGVKTYIASTGGVAEFSQCSIVILGGQA
tara:strand:+ start:137 stop:511 length:375 start_codon:yes stop_codon:yes gene_type:complete